MFRASCWTETVLHSHFRATAKLAPVLMEIRWFSHFLQPVKQPLNSTFHCKLARRKKRAAAHAWAFNQTSHQGHVAYHNRTIARFCGFVPAAKWFEMSEGTIRVYFCATLPLQHMCMLISFAFISLLFFFWVTVWGRQDGIHALYWALDKGVLLPLGTWIKTDMIMQAKNKVPRGLRTVAKHERKTPNFWSLIHSSSSFQWGLLMSFLSQGRWERTQKTAA